MEVPPYPRLRFAPPAVPSPTSWGTDPFKISWRERLPPTRRLRRRVPSPFAFGSGGQTSPGVQSRPEVNGRLGWVYVATRSLVVSWDRWPPAFSTPRALGSSPCTPHDIAE